MKNKFKIFSIAILIIGSTYIFKTKEKLEKKPFGMLYIHRPTAILSKPIDLGGTDGTKRPDLTLATLVEGDSIECDEFHKSKDYFMYSVKFRGQTAYIEADPSVQFVPYKN